MRLHSGILFTLCLFLLLAAAPSAAENLMMARSKQSFPEAMLTLQDAIGARGYTVSRVQRVDIGLTTSGFQTDKYRVVFYGKAQEQRQLAHKYPQLIPYLPLKMTVFAEEDETLIVAADPLLFEVLVDDPETAATFKRWKEDLVFIMEKLRETE